MRGLAMHKALGIACFMAAPLSAQPESVLSYLPDESQLSGWETLGEPQTAEGDDLFLLINGGAEIYHEYGFARAVMHSYVRGEKSVNLEVYEMEDVASAYGAYSFKTGREGESVAVGTESRFEDYYLNFWKGNVVVTLIGFDTDQETREAILMLARSVEGKITQEGARPELVELLPEYSIGGDRAHLTYVEGNLALMNRYRFANGNVFDVRRGVVADYGDHLTFLFLYEDETQTFDRVAIAADLLASSGLYSDVTADELGFTGWDRGGRFLLLRPVGRFAVVCVDTDRPEAFTALDEVAAMLAIESERRVP